MNHNWSKYKSTYKFLTCTYWVGSLAGKENSCWGLGLWLSASRVRTCYITLDTCSIGGKRGN